MTNTIYEELSPYYETGGDMQARIGQLSVHHIFGPLAEVFPEPQTFNGVLFFILEVYSVKSQSLILAGDWQSFKEAQFGRFGIAEQWRADVVALQNPVVRNVCRDYVDYQEATTWRHYCMLQDLYTQLLSMALDMRSSVEEKHKAAKYSKELIVDINEFKDKLKQEYHMLVPAKKELPKAKKLLPVTLNVEDHAKELSGS